MEKVADNFISTQWANWCNPEEPLRASLHRQIANFSPKVPLFQKYLWEVDHKNRRLLALATLCTYDSDQENFCAMNEWVEFYGYSKFHLNYDFMKHPTFGLGYFKTLAYKALAVAESALEAQLDKACSDDQAAFLEGNLPVGKFNRFTDTPLVSVEPFLNFNWFVVDRYSWEAYSMLEIKLGDDVGLVASFFRLKNWLGLSTSLRQSHYYPLHLHPTIGLAALETYLKDFMERKVKALLDVHLTKQHHYFTSGALKRCSVTAEDLSTFADALKKKKRANAAFVERYNKMVAVAMFRAELTDHYNLYKMVPFIQTIFNQTYADCKLSLAPKRDRSPRRRSTRLKK